MVRGYLYRLGRIEEKAGCDRRRLAASSTC
jgi:hypothetical protein